MGKIRRAACALALGLVAAMQTSGPEARAQDAAASPVTFAVFDPLGRHVFDSRCGSS